MIYKKLASIFFLLCFGNRDPPTQMSFLTSPLQLVTSAMQGGIVASIMNITSPCTPIWVLFTQIVPRSHISQAQYQVATLNSIFKETLQHDSWPCNEIQWPNASDSHWPALFGLHEYTLWQLAG